MAVASGSRTDRAYRVAVNSESDVWQNRLNTLYAPIPVKPFTQGDWPVPLNDLVEGRFTAIRAQAGVWQNRLGDLYNSGPFAQDDWPVPQNRLVAGYVVAINAQSGVWQNPQVTVFFPIPTKPFPSGDWPNPLNNLPAAYQVARSSQSGVWQNPQLNVFTTQPFTQDDWPNPQNRLASGYLAAISAIVWQNPQLTVFFPIPTKPFLQSDWPLPFTRLAQGYQASINAQPGVWQEPQTNVFFPIPTKPFNQTEWPNPRGIPSRAAYDSQANVYENRLPITPFGTPFAQYDWPNPQHRLVAGRYAAVTAWMWQDRNTTLFVAIPTKPFAQSDWSVPLNRLDAARRAARDASSGVWSNPLLGPIFPTLIDEATQRRLFDIYPPHLVLVDCSQGTAFHTTVTLPSIQVMGVRRYWIKRIDNTSARTLTIVPYVDDTIEGVTSILLPDQYDSIELISDNVHTWYIVSGRGIA